MDLNDIADTLAARIKVLAEKAEDADTIKKLTSAAKDIRDIKGIKTDEDLREQRARIEKLEKEAKGNVADNGYTGVVLLPPIAQTLTPPTEDDDG